MTIQYEDFAKLDLRVGVIKQAEPIPGSEKLIKLLVDIGEENLRQILAGIVKFYDPEELIGQSIIVITNLAPRKMMGVESQGMLLAADSENGPVILQPLRAVPAGSIVR